MSGCQGFLNSEWLFGVHVSVQDGIVRQWAASVHLGCLLSCGHQFWLLGSLGLYWGHVGLYRRMFSGCEQILAMFWVPLPSPYLIHWEEGLLA